MTLAKGSKLAAMMGRRLRTHLKEKGRKYYAAGKVRIQESGQGFARAIVRGTSDYVVNLGWDGGVSMDCSCPFFKEHNVCKHIWAVVLAAERGEPKKRQGNKGSGGGRSGRWRDILAGLQGTGSSNGASSKPDPTAWEFALQVLRSKKGHRYLVQGTLIRGEERRRLVEPEMEAYSVAEASELEPVSSEPPVIFGPGVNEWVPILKAHPRFVVPGPEAGEFLDRVMSTQPVPRLLLPRDLRFKELSFKPVPCLVVRNPAGVPESERLEAELFCEYDGVKIPAKPFAQGRYDPRGRRFLVRDPSAENSFWLRLLQAGLTRDPQSPGGLALHQGDLPDVVAALVPEGWRLDAHSSSYLSPTSFKVRVSEVDDGFDVDGTMIFNGNHVSLGTLLTALENSERLLPLMDGSKGVLPDDWAKVWTFLARSGQPRDGKLHFARGQVALLDALHEIQPKTDTEEVKEHARKELQWFQRIEPGKAPSSFKGTLRAYQREGLGWLHMLRRFGLGGCLADDMGLGKTVQVLALLESRRLELREQAERAEQGKLKVGEVLEKGPSLVVVPRSLLFNWQQETKRFAPAIRVLEHFGLSRPKDEAGFKGYDIVLTTYGTLRRDITFLKDCVFDYAILDEAQAVKNAATASSKAVRLIQAKNRLALSGTPVENHIGELWNLLEFLNPGMFGSINGIDINAPVEVMAKTLRPLILRRTKDQVARDLPEKIEQTLTCVLEGEQLKTYEKIRDHYKRTLFARVERDGMASSQMEVLEALLRLRQAACHSGLIDKEGGRDVPSAKLELLIPQLQEVIEGGHKALVFSQFTSFLSLVKDSLDAEKIPYLYLDGRTRDRGAKVEQFQNDPKFKIFLVSLKAGGVGLNLTAAEYVFILDPWWNPAVEAQAVDRAHRIGQTKKVFAYRIVAKNTVEERILEMQKDKKDLAEAILGGGDGAFKKLSREDLERLLG